MGKHPHIEGWDSLKMEYTSGYDKYEYRLDQTLKSVEPANVSEKSVF